MSDDPNTKTTAYPSGVLMLGVVLGAMLGAGELLWLEWLVGWRFP